MKLQEWRVELSSGETVLFIVAAGDRSVTYVLRRTPVKSLTGQLTPGEVTKLCSALADACLAAMAPSGNSMKGGSDEADN